MITLKKNMALLVDYFSTKCIVRSWQYISKLSKTEKAESEFLYRKLIEGLKNVRVQ